MIQGRKEMYESDSSSINMKIQTMTVNPNKVATILENIDVIIYVYQVAVNKTINQLEETRQIGLTWITI